MAKYNEDKEKEFNPVKEVVGGKEAEKVIWTTSVIERALEALQQGKPLKVSPFYNKNTKLLKPELVYKRTKEEIEDYIKCKKDPVYFASKCYLMTEEGLQACQMRDYQVDYLHHLQNHRFSILLSCRQAGKSVTTAIYCLWVILFNIDKAGLILSKSGPAGQDLIKKIKDMYLYLPYHLKIGTMKWNQTEISFDNNSSISTEAFSPTAGLGKTINFLILDEFAWCPPNDVELFYNNIIPTITTISDSHVCIMSTQNGFNLFYKLWRGAIEGKSMYAPFKIDWDQVPQWNKKLKRWEKRTEKWKQDMIGVLGSEEAFYYQYGTQFSASDYCLVSRECLASIRDKTVLWDNRNDELEELGIRLVLQHPELLTWDPSFDLNLLRNGEGHFLIIGDLAEGGGGDFTVFNIFLVLGKCNLIHVGQWRSNKIDLEHTALEFWLLCNQLFNDENSVYSIEWNTYGALFYNIVMNLNEYEYDNESSYRFNICQSELNLENFIRYKKESIDEQILKKGKRNSKSTIPGFKFTGSNKGASCTLLKMMFEKEQIQSTDLITVGELENFEDKNGNGTYKASIGHDDSIMTFVQIPNIVQTVKFSELLENIEASRLKNTITNKWENTNLLDYEHSGFNTLFNPMLEPDYFGMMQNYN